MKRITFACIVLLLLVIFPTCSFASVHTLWENQCIDTMKYSRDKARDWVSPYDLKNHINWEMKTIKDIGANCVAIDTPYDNEFITYLKAWVQSAHSHGLHVWFRGNFSSWEGWFGYPLGMTTDTLLKKTKEFISANSFLFQDGDIFTPAPEAENGGPFKKGQKPDVSNYRKFLTNEYTTAKEAFTSIHKNVSINWLSMNGGFAKRIFDNKTTGVLGNTITIDHYVKAPQEMVDYITYFRKKFQAKVVLGELGAPIPDINGTMTEHEQARFVKQLFMELYKNKNTVNGINYWDLLDGSTALMNPDKSPREVVSSIKDFFSPVEITGQIKNSVGEPISHVTITSSDLVYTTQSSANGEYALVIPAHYAITLIYKNKEYFTMTKNLTGNNNEVISESFVMIQKNPSILYKMQLQLYSLHQELLAMIKH